MIALVELGADTVGVEPHRDLARDGEHLLAPLVGLVDRHHHRLHGGLVASFIRQVLNLPSLCGSYRILSQLQPGSFQVG